MTLPGDLGDDGTAGKRRTIAFFFDPPQRGLVLANLWAPLSHRAQTFVFTPIDWNRYVGAEPVTWEEIGRAAVEQKRPATAHIPEPKRENSE